MAAAFITLSNKDLFQNIGTASHLVRIPQFDSIIGTAGMAIYTDVSVQLGETVQYFLTFDDVIKYIHFGKGVGSISANGLMFSDSSGELPGVNQFFNTAVSGLRGEPTQIVVGSTTFTGVLVNASLALTAEPDTMAQFQVVFSVINHNL